MYPVYNVSHHTVCKVPILKAQLTLEIADEVGYNLTPGFSTSVPVPPRGPSGAIRGYRDFTDSSSEKIHPFHCILWDRMTVGG